MTEEKIEIPKSLVPTLLRIILASKEVTVGEGLKLIEALKKK